MDIRNRRALKETAGQRLAAARFDPRKLILVHTLVTIGATVLALAVDYLLDSLIANTGGLSGLSTRTTLTAIQTLVSYLPTVMAIFWDVGYFYSLMHIGRGEPTGYQDLPEGFRRPGKVLCYNLWWFLLFFGVGMAAIMAAMTIFMTTPMSTSLMELTLEGMENGTIAQDGTVLDAAVQNAMTDATMPMMVIFVILFAVLLLVMSYPFRMGLFALLDGRQGAFSALRTSAQLMRGNKSALFKLDLSFWWYYLLMAAASVLAYADVLLPALGVALPVSQTAASYLAYGANMVVLLVVYLLARNKVEMTYVLFYEALRDEKAPYHAPEPAPQPKSQPWNYG